MSQSPNKKALSISVRYSHLRDQGLELAHVHQDSDNVVKLLVENFGFSEDDITVLKDSDDGHSLPPTRENILKAMKDLVSDSHEGDRLVFHISGHGSQRTCPIPGQEQDGLDEMFWPVDVEFTDHGIENIILDDTIKNILVDNLQHGVNLMMIADCCHSGTIADLPHGHVDHAPRQQSLRVTTKHEENPTSLPQIVCWSACQDEQKSYNPTGSGGIFTRVLTRVIGGNAGQTHAQAYERVTGLMGRITEDTGLATRPHMSTLYPQTEELQIRESLGELSSMDDASMINRVKAVPATRC